jgi:hypothetical protein
LHSCIFVQTITKQKEKNNLKTQLHAMKKLLMIGLCAFAASQLYGQDIASVFTEKEYLNAAPINETPNFVVTNGYYMAPSGSAAIKVVDANYQKLQVVAVSGSNYLKLQSNFEGSVLLSYIITNASGQVIANKEVSLPSGMQNHKLDMSNATSGNYFITAKVSSKVTKVQSNFSFKVEKK